MAWTTPMTFVASTVLTAAQLNTFLRDNFMETEPAKATTPGGIMISTGLNEIVERAGGSQNIETDEETVSTTYADLGTVGPRVTVNTATRAFIFITAAIKINADNVTANMSVEVSGATNQLATDVGSLMVDGIVKDKEMRIGICNFFENLTPGDNTFTAKYKVVSGTRTTFSDRNLTVIPF